MNTKLRYLVPAMLALAAGALPAGATRLLECRVADRGALMLHFRDGEVRYRDDGTGRSAFLGHYSVPEDDWMVPFGEELNVKAAALAESWTVVSSDDAFYSEGVHPKAVSRKSKPLNTTIEFESKLDHWLFLELPSPMKQGCSYSVRIAPETGSDTSEGSVLFDVFSSPSEAVHVNVLGYSPSATPHAADLYLWTGEAGSRDYSFCEGGTVWLVNADTGARTAAGEVRFWKGAEDSRAEALGRNLTGSPVWTADFSAALPGRYRIAVEGVGCSMDFDISPDIYAEPYRYSILGYYFMRLGEPVTDARPAPRQPRFIPGEDPSGLKVYLTDLQPWHPLWRTYRGDIWDEPHFKPTRASMFWKHRLEGNPVNDRVTGGHSDAFDWDRHLAHVSNIYDLLLPYILSGGLLSEDDLGIRESGNGIPDIIDEARNEVDFWLSCRDGDAYCHGVTNPSASHEAMFQAGATTMAAWANAANCAMIAEAFRIAGNGSLSKYYAAEAEKAYRFALRQKDLQMDDFQGIGNCNMRGRDFRQMAAAYLYNVTGKRYWEDEAREWSLLPLYDARRRCQIWGAAASLTCTRRRHYPEWYASLAEAVTAEALEHNVRHMDLRPSRRSSNDNRWQTAENLQLVMLAHHIAGPGELKDRLLRSMVLEADWGLGRNPMNTVEMTGLGQRCLTDIYSTGRNDGAPGTHPGQTPFNSIDTWTAGNGGDPQILVRRCYPEWVSGGWPYQEASFNCRYFWAHSEFTPRETMRGKTALLAYLHSLRPVKNP